MQLYIYFLANVYTNITLLLIIIIKGHSSGYRLDDRRVRVQIPEG
jgi:hypothetical protein